MLRQITRTEIETLIKNLDTRAKTFTSDEFDYVINMGYAELSTFNHLFYNEEIVSLADQYEAGELSFVMDIEEDVAFIYDLYLAKESSDESLLDGIKKERTKRAIYKDERYAGRVHVNLDNADTSYENAVIKYSFTPRATSEHLYIDQQTYLALRDAFSCSLYNKLGDVERESQKRASLARTARAVIPKYPQDYIIPNDTRESETEGRIYKRSMFSGLL